MEELRYLSTARKQLQRIESVLFMIQNGIKPLYNDTDRRNNNLLIEYYKSINK
jgi:hypothetical protein